MGAFATRQGDQAPMIDGVPVTASAADLNKATGLGGLLGSVVVAADELAIPVTHRHVAKTTGADAEALSLANGTPGQKLTVTLVVDGGGTGTLTPATSTGFASIAFADAGDTATLEYIDDTVGWILIGCSGVAGVPAIALS